MPVTKTLHKRFHSFEQEEKWLNELADLGWRLIAFGDGETNLAYTFELDPAVTGLHYKIDFRKMKNKSEYEDYVTLFEETGWQQVPCRWNNYKYIFISNVARDIYSDNASLIDRERQRRKAELIGFSIFVVGIIGCAIWYYYRREDSLPVLIIIYSVVAIYLAWRIWNRTKNMKQHRG